MLRRRLIALAGLVLIPALARAEAKEEKRKKGGGPNYIQIQTLTATVVRPEGGRGVMTVEVGLDVPEKSLRERAEASTPRLRAAYAGVVQAYAQGLGGGSPPNADFLSRELQRETDFVLGRPGARLLLGGILVN